MAVITRQRFKSASTPVYKQGPSSGSSAATPSAGVSTGANEVWMETYADGATSPTYILVQPKNTVVAATDLV